MFILKDKKPLIKSNKEHIMQLITNNHTVNKYILGINNLTKAVIVYCLKNNTHISGIIDDFTDDVYFEGYKIVKTEEISKSNSIIISCVIDCKAYTAKERLAARGFQQINFLEMALFEKGFIEEVHHCQSICEDINENFVEYEKTYHMFEDDMSKEMFLNVLDFRYNFNIDALKNIKLNLEGQYFEEFLPTVKQESFIDCGGYDGNTTIEFIKRNPNYERIYYFEPSLQQFNLSKERLKEYPNVQLFNNATYSDNIQLKFANENQSNGCISDSGSTLVKAVKLDSIIDQPVTFIKMDVEGAEFDTLRGAEHLIKQYSPKLAVCVYHNQKDFWRIPQMLLEWNPKYKVYLRHYTQGLLETVMYFVEPVVD